MDINKIPIKQLIALFNEQAREEFQWMREEKYHLLKEKKWLYLNGKPAIHSKFSSQQQKFALEKCLDIGVRATSRLLQVNRRTLQRWLRYYKIDVPRYPNWLFDWVERKKKKREFWRRRGY